jgi:hypothetical protein
MKNQKIIIKVTNHCKSLNITELTEKLGHVFLKKG